LSARHIHVKVRHDDIADNGQFTTQLYFDGDPYLPADRARLAGARLAMSVIRHEADRCSGRTSK
jgi:protocatechuate 3,4-dioxygenase beta subunit